MGRRMVDAQRAGSVRYACSCWDVLRPVKPMPHKNPSTPEKVYEHDGWQGWGHWLGIGNVRGGNGQQFLPFKKALVYVRSLKLQTHEEWAAWRKSDARPPNIPSNPNATYKHEGWCGYAHWLGTV